MTGSSLVRILACAAVIAVPSAAMGTTGDLRPMDSIGANAVDPLHAERIVLVTTVAGRDRETALSGPAGLIDAASACATTAFVPLVRWIVETRSGSTDEIRYRTTPDQVDVFAACTARTRP